MTDLLAGKIALVTGGSRGLGKSISIALAEAGAIVAVNYANNQADAEQTVELIRELGGQAVAIQGDITDEEAVDNLVRRAEAEAGGTIDILVNNATGPQPEVSIDESTWSDYLDQLDFFVKAPLLLTKAVLPGMKMKKSGRIINIGSEVVQLGNAHFANYVTAKSAQIGMTRSWASELGPFGITVNLINPGFIPVERHEEVAVDVLAQYQNQVPLQRMGEPSDISNTIVFIASDKASFITGQSLSVNGGNTFGV
ncbi:SDR family NAD(P)-dependent oxidoreductase [Gracilibacillus alcaliphilus]|uniref:SDR family NAD(P)-dependent oxidoreductase n=1 Tax=Gracilibacillus alcaliphilus TaxID=1401441 RepID=UPI001959DEED|nr:SDR family oxidoreductase [Gracilibacillus alcaliphilus]MBM7677485.1 3-oxoacyl-[acyl-carrier protein] reductase [Gracilibacillus alcaliphilus]